MLCILCTMLANGSMSAQCVVSWNMWKLSMVCFYFGFGVQRRCLLAVAFPGGLLHELWWTIRFSLLWRWPSRVELQAVRRLPDTFHMLAGRNIGVIHRCNRHVAFSEQLDVNTWPSYQLRALIVHSGSDNVGHYHAYVWSGVPCVVIDVRAEVRDLSDRDHFQLPADSSAGSCYIGNGPTYFCHKIKQHKSCRD